MTIKKKSTKNESTTQTKGGKIARLLENALIATMILGALGFFWASYFGFRERVLTTYETMANNVENYIFLDENLYFFCKDSFDKNIDNKNCDCLKDIELSKMRQIMTDELGKIIKNIRLLGGMMSYQTYYKILQLLDWNDLLLSSEKGICGSGLLAKPANMDKWRNEIVKQIMEERELNKRLFYSLKNYFMYLFTDVENYRYVRSEFDLNKLPIYKKLN